MQVYYNNNNYYIIAVIVEASPTAFVLSQRVFALALFKHDAPPQLELY